MKTRFNQRRRTLLVSGGLYSALLLSGLPHIYAYAEDRAADSPFVELKKEKVKRNEQPMEPDNTRETVRLVGPSGEEIHDFLYPTPKDGKGVTPAN
jgi:hypothetical protein